MMTFIPLKPYERPVKVTNTTTIITKINKVLLQLSNIDFSNAINLVVDRTIRESNQYFENPIDSKQYLLLGKWLFTGAGKLEKIYSIHTDGRGNTPIIKFRQSGGFYVGNGHAHLFLETDSGRWWQDIDCSISDVLKKLEEVK